MIKNSNKVAAAISNAKSLQSIIKKHGSVHTYIERYAPTASLENLLLLKEDLQHHFAYLGGITVYHFLTDIGLNVLKPDRVVTRIFQLLGLIEHTDQLLKTIIQGRKFAAATNHSIRYIDILFVTYGAKGDQGICLKVNPKCHLYGLTSYCHFY